VSNVMDIDNDKRCVARHIERARVALATFKTYDQEQIDEVVTGVAWAICKPANAPFEPRQSTAVEVLEHPGVRVGLLLGFFSVGRVRSS
jgi:hypothetical protein